MNEAERLAKELDGTTPFLDSDAKTFTEAAAELRRLAAENEALRRALGEARKIVVEVCGACSVPLPEATLERVDAALAARPGEKT